MLVIKSIPAFTLADVSYLSSHLRYQSITIAFSKTVSIIQHLPS